MDKTIDTIWCRSCHGGIATKKPWPPECPHCRQWANWSENSLVPLKGYTLNGFNDRRFLRSLRIQPE